MVDSGAFVELFKHELIVLKLRVCLNDTFLDENQGISWSLLSEHDLVFLLRLRLQAKHQVEKNLIVVLCEVLDALDHSQYELNFLVPVGPDCVLLESNLVLGEL